jgi:hypothetical protein
MIFENIIQTKTLRSVVSDLFILHSITSGKECLTPKRHFDIYVIFIYFLTNEAVTDVMTVPENP